MTAGLLTLDKISLLDKRLSSFVSENKIKNYQIKLLLTTEIEVDILVETQGNINFLEFPEFEGYNQFIRVNEWEQDELPEWQEKHLFSNGQKHIDKSMRRRLSNLIELKDRQENTPCPIITFYSYKGGVGRTTTLAFFASWLATHHSKKVIIIDCDFEAPGFSNANYFDLNREEKKGVVEYFLDKQFSSLSGEYMDILKDYAYQVRPEYVGKGDIFVIPAGNLSLEEVEVGRTRRDDYLESLSRLDISSIDNIINQFHAFFSDLKNQLGLDYNNSVILIDSRTGFNDIFAILSALSNIIVGFFGNNKQSRIGLTEFLDNFGTTENRLNKQIIIVNSISSSKFEGLFKEFVRNYLEANLEKFHDEELGMVTFDDNIFRLDRIPELEEIGTEVENRDFIKMNGSGYSSDKLNKDFIEFIARTPAKFEDLFEEIVTQIDAQIEKYESFNNEKGIEYIESSPLMYNGLGNEIPLSDRLEDAKRETRPVMRERLLLNLANENNFPKLYADDEQPKLDNFYFRDCMKSIFNRDMFLIVGYKGTGKTHIYQSFKNKEITERLCARNNENYQKYIFVNVIPVHDESKKDSYFDISKFSKSSINQVGNDYFFERFWLAYVWSSIFSDENKRKMGYNFSLSQPSRLIINDNDSAEWFRNAISDDTQIKGFEQDLKKLDSYLLSKDKIIILSFDELDFIVKPNEWSQGIAPLVKYWRNNIFSRIYPKIFARADLFGIMGNTTNANEMKEKSIDLQWSKEELFAYFFKFVFKVDKIDFLKLCYAFGDFSEKTKKTILEIEHSLDDDRQVATSEIEKLKFLVDAFFGKSANRYDDTPKSFGSSYDWFYKNLTDAKNTISIRPFLDLIKESIKIALEPSNLNQESQRLKRLQKVLSALYYSSKRSKEYCVKRYYDDLSRDEGNEFLGVFYRYIRQDGLAKYRVYEFKREVFDELLRAILNRTEYRNEPGLKNQTEDDLRNILVNNGIVSVSQKTERRLTYYTIPFLYRDFLGVTKPDRYYHKN